MSYTNDSSSSSLKPILCGVSVATAIIFGGMYFYYTSSAQHLTASEPAAEPAAQQPQAAAAAPVRAEAPVTSAMKAKSRTRV